MAVIRYIATRSLAPGVAFNTERTIENAFHSRPRTSEFKGVQREALDGTPESYLHAIIRRYDVTSDYLEGISDLIQWREFLDSVRNHEVFEIDFTGTLAAPGDIIDMWLESKSIQELEVRGLIRQISFTVREFPTS